MLTKAQLFPSWTKSKRKVKACTYFCFGGDVTICMHLLLPYIILCHSFWLSPSPYFGDVIFDQFLVVNIASWKFSWFFLNGWSSMKRSEATPGGGVFRKKGVLRNFAKFTGKRLRHWCFFLRILWNFLETFSYGTLSLAASVLSLFSQITNNRFAIWLKGVPHMFTHLEFFQQFSRHFKLLFKIVFGYYEQN